jgi:hypothetical protein
MIGVSNVFECGKVEKMNGNDIMQLMFQSGSMGTSAVDMIIGLYRSILEQRRKRKCLLRPEIPW